MDWNSEVRGPHHCLYAVDATLATVLGPRTLSGQGAMPPATGLAAGPGASASAAGIWLSRFNESQILRDNNVYIIMQLYTSFQAIRFTKTASISSI